jgi:L-ribulose-5-phosphate 3-epimerase UlaE
MGAGLIDHEKAFKALKNINYDSTITLEVFTNIKTSDDKLRMLWANEYYIPSRYKGDYK